MDVDEITRDLDRLPFKLDYRWSAVRETFSDLFKRGFVGEQASWTRDDLDRLVIALSEVVWREAVAGELTGEHPVPLVHYESCWLHRGDHATQPIELDPPHSTLTRALDIIRLLRSMMGPDDRLQMYGEDQ